jgi:hypothetical protein
MRKGRTTESRLVVDADILGFAGHYATLFGTTLASGLAGFVRQTPEFQTWLSKHEWCEVCKEYGPLNPHGVRRCRCWRELVGVEKKSVVCSRRSSASSLQPPVSSL